MRTIVCIVATVVAVSARPSLDPSWHYASLALFPDASERGPCCCALVPDLTEVRVRAVEDATVVDEFTTVLDEPDNAGAPVQIHAGGVLQFNASASSFDDAADRLTCETFDRDTGARLNTFTLNGTTDGLPPCTGMWSFAFGRSWYAVADEPGSYELRASVRVCPGDPPRVMSVFYDVLE